MNFELSRCVEPKLASVARVSVVCGADMKAEPSATSVRASAPPLRAGGGLMLVVATSVAGITKMVGETYVAWIAGVDLGLVQGV